MASPGMSNPNEKAGLVQAEPQVVMAQMVDGPAMQVSTCIAGR